MSLLEINRAEPHGSRGMFLEQELRNPSHARDVEVYTLQSTEIGNQVYSLKIMMHVNVGASAAELNVIEIIAA